MPRLVLVGASAPLIKVIDKISGLEGLDPAGLFTPLGESSEVEEAAQRIGLPLYEAAQLKEPAGLKQLTALKPDWLYSVNSTLILPEEVLRVPTKGALNVHPGRLPEYAGLHTHQWAIRNGEETFGAALHFMAPGIDTGDVALTAEFPITPRDTGLTLFLKCMNAGAELAAEALQIILEGRDLPRRPQDLSRRRLYTHQMALKGDVSWTDPARRIVDFIRAADYAPFTCPTYTPTASIQGRTLFLRKARLDQGRGNRPGLILEVNETGLAVAAGDGVLVRLTSVEEPGRGVFKGTRLFQELGLKPGTSFDLA